MTKQEMAVEMCAVANHHCHNGNWYVGDHRMSWFDPEQFIYSPDGFFAVWDAVENNSLLLQNPKPIMHGYECYVSSLDEDHEGTGKDRYEAFYNAVYEAMK